MTKKYSKSHSNYITKSNPIPTDNGIILENDLRTYGEPYNYVNGNLTIKTEGGFTFITNTSPTDKKEYSNGEFGESYTLNDFLSITTGSNKIDVESLSTQIAPEPTFTNFNKTYFDLSKFSYFGSTNEFIKSSIEDIINRFPGSLYINNPSNLMINGENNSYIEFGRLYNWYAVTDPRGIAPTGWHVPSISDWQTLFDYTQGICVKYQEVGFTHWDSRNTLATNEYNLNVYGSGEYVAETNIFRSILYMAFFLTSDNENEDTTYVFDMTAGGNGIGRYYNSKRNGASLRLIKDNDILGSGFTDTDGNIYTEVKIGSQVWIQQNYSGNHYTNGDLISSDFSGKIGASTFYGNITGTSIKIPNNKINNPFNINIADYTYDRPILPYDLKIMATSYTDYTIQNNDNDILANVIGFTNDLTGITLELDKKISLSSSFHIKPSLKKQNEFFDSLDGFQSTLLNRKTLPKYKSVFKIPEENEIGISNVYRNFIWKTYDGYNLDVTSTDYTMFIQDLIDGSNFVDEKYSDNIYRMMTHDSIKNMDSTYQMIDNQDLLDEYIAGGTKIQSILRLYGRFYDEIKKYAEGIGFNNNISYDKIDNLPEKFLQDKVNSLGWENPALINTFPLTGNTSTNLFPGSIGPYNTNESSNEINRRIILSSKHLATHKGTKKSIRNLFGLFGIDESIYSIREYTQKIDNYLTGTTLQNIISLNQDFRSTQIENLYGSSDILTTDISLTGINVGTFEINGVTYGYPKPRSNSNIYYFQQMGGWYRETGGLHTNLIGETYVNNTITGNNPHIGNGSYDYGYDYIDQFNDLFKTDLNQQGNYPNINLNNYKNKGFNALNKKSIDNKKIHWVGANNYLNDINILTDDFDIPILTDSDEKIYTTSYGNSDSKLTLNLKNFVIGIDAGKALELFYSGNNIGITGITKEEVFNSIKNLILPYLEQIIPSTTIFDFVLINKNTPKWVLVDKYYGRYDNSNQNYNGQTILKYKNMNYFDESSKGFGNDLLTQIKNDFGDMFVQIPTIKDTIVGFEREILFSGDNGEAQRDESPIWIEKTGLFNF